MSKPTYKPDGLGPAAIAAAAFLWATDALVRYPALGRIDALSLVMLDHALALAVLIPIVGLRRRAQAVRIRVPDMVALALIGLGGSALATVLFTRSFSHAHPSVAILVQKLQPLIAITLSTVFLGERRTRTFYAWSAVALGAAILLALPNIGETDVAARFNIRSVGAVFALAAAVLWAISTVIGKRMLRHVPPDVATLWRYGFGLLGLILISLATRGQLLMDGLVLDDRLGLSIAYMALVPGLAGMLLYYVGLRRTPATTVTIVELVFPVVAIALNWALLSAALSPAQLALSTMLLVAVTAASRAR